MSEPNEWLVVASCLLSSIARELGVEDRRRYCKKKQYVRRPPKETYVYVTLPPKLVCMTDFFKGGETRGQKVRDLRPQD